jgi:soluble lytic murein transglycosylase-like protein
MLRALPALLVCVLLVLPVTAHAGTQIYEPLAASVRSALSADIADRAQPTLVFERQEDGRKWLLEMSARLARRIPDNKTRVDFLTSVHYEARRAGLDPQLVLGLIQVESNFKKYVVSKSGARGYMQVMPFWTGLIGRKDDNLFRLRTNLRYGCVILRHYLDIEKGNLYRALARYNGSLGKPGYPRAVETAWKTNWYYAGKSA